MVRLDEGLIEFLGRPLMCILAGADAAGRPSAGRGVGVAVLEGGERVEVVFSAWQWPRLEADIRATGRVAATFVRPSDYVSYQVKGEAAVRAAGAADLARAARFIAAATGELEGLGVPPALIAPWLTTREARVSRIVVREVYVQTPGPQAGMRAGGR